LPSFRGCEEQGHGARRLPTSRGIRFIDAVSTVAEIESALEKLPVDKQREVAAWLEAKLWPETPAMLAAIDEAERSLAEEGGVPIEDVRRNLSQWITK
jgi:hypothetical protein